MRFVNVVVMLGTFAGLAGAFFGCGTSRPDAAGGDGTFNSTTEACNTPGETRDCKFIVSQVNDVRTCAPGSQICTNGYWSACGPDGRAAPSLLQSIPLDPASNGGLHLANVNPASDGGPACANPCDPACTGYNEACGADGGSLLTFPPTNFPQCGTVTPKTDPNCDCTNPALDCKQECKNIAGCSAIARGPKKGDFKCDNVSGLCDFKCEGLTDCKVDCKNTGTCSTTCLAGSVCKVKCDNVANCPVNCAVGAVCIVDECKNGSSCPITPLLDACTQTPQFSLPNILAPGANQGHENKLLDDPCHPGGSSAPCEVSAFGTTKDDGRMASTCQADTYCKPAATGGDGCCTNFQPGETQDSVSAGGLTCATSGPDLTLPGVCKTPNGDLAVMICNRGNAPSTGRHWVGTTNPNDAPHNAGTAAAPTCETIGGAASYVCRYDGTIAPGQCAVILNNAPLGLGCAGNLPNGNKGIMLNGPDVPAGDRITECDLDVKNAVSALQPTQPGCANNMHAYGAPGQIPNCLGGYGPTKITQDYTATCDPGKRAKWTTLGWAAVTPGAGAQRSSIEFYATIQGTGIDGGPLAPSGPQLIGKAWNNPATPQTVPPNYANYVQGPASCRPDAPTVAPAPICPKDLANTIGAPAPNGFGPSVLYGDKLTLDIFLKPSQNGLNVPTLQNWWISYTCVDYE